MNNSYLFIDKHKSTTSVREFDGKYVISQSSGVNSENFVIKRNSKELQFSIFKLNGIYYVNLNGQHIIDYKTFVKISQISMVEDDSVKVYNPCIGTIVLKNCEVDLVCKALKLMNDWMKGKLSFWKDIYNFFF